MGQACCCCSSREALSDAEPALSTDVRLTRGRKRSERHLLLLHKELVVAKLRHGTSLRPQLCLALDQLWVLSSGKEAAGQDGQGEEEQGTDEDSTSVILAWPTGSCIATFGENEDVVPVGPAAVLWKAGGRGSRLHPGGGAALYGGLVSLKKWIDLNIVKVVESKCDILPLGHADPALGSM